MGGPPPMQQNPSGSAPPASVSRPTMQRPGWDPQNSSIQPSHFDQQKTDESKLNFSDLSKLKHDNSNSQIESFN